MGCQRFMDLRCQKIYLHHWSTPTNFYSFGAAFLWIVCGWCKGNNFSTSGKGLGVHVRPPESAAWGKILRNAVLGYLHPGWLWPSQIHQLLVSMVIYILLFWLLVSNYSWTTNLTLHLAGTQLSRTQWSFFLGGWYDDLIWSVHS